MPTREKTVEHHQRPVIVGVDGSPAADRAARFAADDARRRGAPLLLIHALTWPFAGALAASEVGAESTAAVHSGAESLLRALAESLSDVLPSSRISWRVEAGDPVAALGADSATAEIVVVGGSGIGRVADMLIGSTASALAATARCPVIVMPNDSFVRTSDHRCVVVGVEGLGQDDEVLGFAFAEAAARGTDLVAVHAWKDIGQDPPLRSVSPLADEAGAASVEQRVLAEAIAGWREKQPDVVVREVVVRERAVPALTALSLTAELLVVGRRPHRSTALLGSAAHGLLHRAGCPVALIPVEPGRRETSS